MKNDQTTHPDIKSPLGRQIVILLIDNGFPQHRIASLFDENQGRVSEVISDNRSVA